MKIVGGRQEQRFSHFGTAKWGLTFEGLGDLFGTRKGQEDIIPLLYPSAGKGRVRFFSSELPLHQLLGHRRVAPGSLKKMGYQKAIWHIKSLTFDPSTYERLLASCPVCGVLLSFQSTIGLCYCHACIDPDDEWKPVVDLRDFPQLLVEFDDEEALRFVTGLIDPETRQSEGPAAVHSDLQAINSGQLFEFTAQIAKALDVNEGLSEPLRSNFAAVGEVTPKNLAVAGRAMMGWPHRFIELAERLKDAWFFPRTKDVYSHPLRVRVASDYYDPGFRKMIASAIKSSLRSTVLIASTTDITTQKEGIEKSGQASWSALVRYANSSKLIRGESALSGLPISALLACYEFGFRCPDEILGRNWSRASQSIGDLLAIRLPRTRTSKPSLSLRDVVSALNANAFNPWPGVLQALLDQSLPASRSLPKPQFIDAVSVTKFKPWKKFFDHLSQTPEASDAEVTGGEAGFHLNISSTQVSYLVASGLLPSGRVSMSAIWEFRRKFISPKEVAARLQINGEIALPNVVGAELNKAGIEPVHPGTFVRERLAVEQFYSQRLA
jgi:hypothetical protein